MHIKAQIEEKLQKAFLPHTLEVIDESDKHMGHSGWREGGETHFLVQMEGGTFEGITKVAQHREIYKALEAEIEAGVHALAIKLS